MRKEQTVSERKQFRRVWGCVLCFEALFRQLLEFFGGKPVFDMLSQQRYIHDDRIVGVVPADHLRDQPRQRAGGDQHLIPVADAGIDQDRLRFRQRLTTLQRMKFIDQQGFPAFVELQVDFDDFLFPDLQVGGFKTPPGTEKDSRGTSALP